MSNLAQWAVTVGCESSTSTFRLGTYFRDRDEFQCSWYVQACSASLCSPVALETPVSKFRCSKEEPGWLHLLLFLLQGKQHSTLSSIRHLSTRPVLQEKQFSNSPQLLSSSTPAFGGCGKKCRHKQKVVNHLCETEKYSCDFIALPHFRSEVRMNQYQLASKQ